MEIRAAETKPPDTQPFQASKGEHPMLDIPYVIVIDGRQFRGNRLSLVMAEISGLMDPALERANRLMRLAFPFHGFSVTLDVLGVVQSVDRDKGTATVSFVEPGGAHLPQMRHILNACIAGDLVSMGDVIGVGATAPTPAARSAQVAGGIGRFGRRLLGTLGILAATVALAGLVGYLGYSRIFTKPIHAAGRVVQDGITLDAVAAGQLDYVNPQAAQGEVAFAIRAVSGELLSISMPCDCTAALQGAPVGGTVQAGDAVMTVHADDAPVIVSAEVGTEDMLNLTFADHVRVQFRDGTEINASVDPGSLRAPSGTRATTIDLIPETALPAAWAGQVVHLTAIRPLPFRLGAFDITTFERLSAYFGK